eukprot:scaffold32250_cov31-Tisochrysis_lutea.AAC.1
MLRISASCLAFVCTTRAQAQGTHRYYTGLSEEFYEYYSYSYYYYYYLGGGGKHGPPKYLLKQALARRTQEPPLRKTKWVTRAQPHRERGQLRVLLHDGAERRGT